MRRSAVLSFAGRPATPSTRGVTVGSGRGFTLIELLVVVSIITLLIGLLLPVLGAGRRTAQQLRNSTQMRGIHQAFVIFAEENRTGGRDGRYPGLDAAGGLDGLNPVPAASLGVGAAVPPPVDVDAMNPVADGLPNDDDTFGDFVFATLLRGDFLMADVLVSPADDAMSVFRPDPAFNLDMSDHASYGMTTLRHGGGYVQEWASTGSSTAMILADRFAHVAGEPFDEYNSVWTDEDSQSWEGSFVMNDNATRFSPTAEAEGLKYGTDRRFDADLAGGAQHGWGVFWFVDSPDGIGPGAMVKDVDGR